MSKPKISKITKTSGRPKNFWKFWISMCIFGFSAEIQKNTWTFFGFQQKSYKTHANFWIFSRNPKKHMECFGFSAEIQAEASNTARITIMQLSCEPQRKLPQFEISIGDGIQDPRSKIAQGSSLGILDLGSWILVPIEISIGSIGFNRDPKFCQQISGQSWRRK